MLIVALLLLSEPLTGAGAGQGGARRGAERTGTGTTIPNTSTGTTTPNVIFVFADDLGSADVGYMGSDISTPNIDTLAKSGVILNQHYVQPMCAPSRAAFITGRYPIHTGFQNGNIGQGELWGLGLHEFTLAEMFKEYGYSTHAVGKWHLGWRTWRHTPVMRGFDTFLGFYFCAHDHFDYSCGNLGLNKLNKSRAEISRIKEIKKRKRKLRKKYKWLNTNDTLKRPKPDTDKSKYFDLRENWINEKGELVDKVRFDLIGHYSANVFTDYAIEQIKTRKKEQPFFVYLNYMNVHAPYQAPQRYIDKYTGHMTGASKDRRAYAAMMSSIDEGIGNITKVLLSEGIYNNTVIVFASDNGANVGDCEGGGDSGNHGNSGGSGSGSTGSGSGSGSGGAEFPRKQKPEPGSNYPLRGGKRSVFEGGIKSVAFVHSPLIKRKGRIMDDMMHVVDWFSTFEDLVSEHGAITPKYKIKQRHPTDSVSLWKAIKKGTVGRRRKFLINVDERGLIGCGPLNPFQAFRKNQWKLIVGGGGPPSGWYSPYTAPVYSGDLPYFQLYDVITDPSETFNVAGMFPDVVLDLMYEIDMYKASTVKSLRRKSKYSLLPYLKDKVPTPISLTVQRNESFYGEPYLNYVIT